MALKAEPAASPATDFAQLRPSWYEIDLGAIAHNYRTLRQWVGPEVKIFACLKRNAYGCGVQPVAQLLEREGTDGRAVGNINDALAMRDAGVSVPILLYPNCLTDAADLVRRHGFMPTVSSPDEAWGWAETGQNKLDVFAKVDVGLFRGGAMPGESLDLLKAIAANAKLRLAGIYTHFHGYDPSTGQDYARWQFAKFRQVLDSASAEGIEIPVRIAANSAVVLQFPEMDLNGVDPGSMLYGIRGAITPERPEPLRHALHALKSHIILLKQLSPDDVGVHPSPFPVETKKTIGLLPLGWGDGFPRRAPEGAEALVRGRRVPVIGPIHLEHLRVDLTNVLDAAVGDEVVLVGRQGNEEIALETVAQQWDMSLLHFYGSLRDHLPRRYLEITTA